MHTIIVTYLGAPTDAAPLGDTYTERYDRVVAYGLDPEERVFEVRFRRQGDVTHRVFYPESRVIRWTEVENGAVA